MSSLAPFCSCGIFLVIHLLVELWQIGVLVVCKSPDALVWLGHISDSLSFCSQTQFFIPLSAVEVHLFLLTVSLPVTAFWGWTTYPSPSYVACSAVHRAPARSPLSWPSCPQRPPTASCVMTVAADGHCTSPSVPTGSTRHVRRTPLSVSWHAPQEGIALPACLSAAHPAPGTHYYSPTETQ